MIDYTTKIVDEIEISMIPKSMVEVYINIDELKADKKQILSWLNEVNGNFLFYPGKIIEEMNQLKLPGLWIVSDFLSFDDTKLKVENEQELESLINQIENENNL